ncbi:MAG: FAD-dependent oxidoreductase [Gammaproteobacteria bacterium]|nr:FAD-dependent oxidoreductase [Gammaproteobacteria bacterium]
MVLRRINNPLVDGENNPVALDEAYTVKGNKFLETMVEIKARYGNNICLLPISGASAGGGVFQVKKPPGQTVVGLQFAATPKPRLSTDPKIAISDIALDEIIIDSRQGKIYAGSAVTLKQLNLALAEKLGFQFKVLGADLTSYTYAQVGATFMTGGMGPQRRYFSDSVCEIALFDGEQVLSIEGDNLASYAGTFGWTGLVTAVCCEFHELPSNEIAFAIPVSNNPHDLSKLLANLAPFCFFDFCQNKALTIDGGSDLILGLEHITAASMQPYLRSGNNHLIDRTRILSNNCQKAGADGLLFVSAFSDKTADDFLFSLVDDADADSFTIAGIELEHTEVFSQPDQMRAIREGIPFAARTQSPEGRYIYKSHTDATICINPNRLEQTIEKLWRVNESYVQSIDDFFLDNEKISGEILVYGHLNPFGIDPHNRITFTCDEGASYQQAERYINQQRGIFYRSLAEICLSSDSIFIGGEKSAASEAEIFLAFNGPENAPATLMKKFEGQIKLIRAASPMFNWRAITPYI